MRTHPQLGLFRILLPAVLFAVTLSAHAEKMSVSPSHINFGNQTVGTSGGNASITVTNKAGSQVQISNFVLSSTQFVYKGPALPLTLAPGQSFSGTVIFVPSAARTYQGTLTFVLKNGWPVAIALSGTGVNSGNTGVTSSSNGATASPAIAPAIMIPPGSQTITAGQAATFTVAVSGTAPLTYQWKKNGTSISGATGSSYATPAETVSDNSAQFTVAVSNTAGSATSNAAVLTVTAATTAPGITTQPVNQAITSGQSATFSVASSGTAPLSYQWKKNGTAVSGATGASYTTPAETVSDNSAQFAVTVSNTAGSATSNAAVLTVTAAATAPGITTQPVNQAITAGQSATFSVASSGTAPLSYQWKKNGTAVSGATGASYTTPAETVSDNSAQFTVTISNTAGNATSNAAVLTVTAATTAPGITTQPVSQAITAGQSATFSVAATGTAPLSYQWSKNGTAISGATGSSYTTPAETVSDNGAQFSVTISNVASSATSSAATLTVSQQTYNYSLQSSVSSLAFSAQIGAAAPAVKSLTISDTSPCPPPAGVPTCHWATTLSADQPWLSVTPSSGTTALNASVTVTTSGLTAGSYTGNVIATAPQLVGSPIKIPVTLTITGAASSVLTSSVSALNFNTVNVGSNSSLGVTLTNGGSASITISGVSVSGAGFTPSGVSSGLILSGGQSATLNVMFAPAATGAGSGSVTVTSTASNATLNIPVSGSGAQPASRTVTLNWAASSSTVAGYDVLRSTVSGGSYTQVNGTSVSTPQYMDTGLQSGQTYYYVVTSVDNSGTQSPYSNQVTVVVP